MLLNRCGATPPDNGFGSPQRTHSKSMSWDPHSDRLFLSLRFGQLLAGGNIFITMPLRSLSCFLNMFLTIKTSVLQTFGHESDLFDIHEWAMLG